MSVIKPHKRHQTAQAQVLFGRDSGGGGTWPNRKIIQSSHNAQRTQRQLSQRSVDVNTKALKTGRLLILLSVLVQLPVLHRKVIFQERLLDILGCS